MRGGGSPSQSTKRPSRAQGVKRTLGSPRGPKAPQGPKGAQEPHKAPTEPKSTRDPRASEEAQGAHGASGATMGAREHPRTQGAQDSPRPPKSIPQSIPSVMRKKHLRQNHNSSSSWEGTTPHSKEPPTGSGDPKGILT